MPGMKCSILGCNNSVAKSKNKELSYHCFPKDENLKAQWIQNCSPSILNFKNARICSAHFMDEDFENKVKSKLLNIKTKNYLKKNAIPSRNLIDPDLHQSNSENSLYRTRLKSISNNFKSVSRINRQLSSPINVNSSIEKVSESNYLSTHTHASKAIEISLDTSTLIVNLNNSSNSETSSSPIKNNSGTNIETSSSPDENNSRADLCCISNVNNSSIVLSVLSNSKNTIADLSFSSNPNNTTADLSFSSHPNNTSTDLSFSSNPNNTSTELSFSSNPNNTSTELSFSSNPMNDCDERGKYLDSTTLLDIKNIESFDHSPKWRQIELKYKESLEKQQNLRRRYEKCQNAYSNLKRQLIKSKSKNKMLSTHLSMQRISSTKLIKDVKRLTTEKSRMVKLYHKSQNILHKVFSESQIKILNGKKKVIWSNEDLANAFTLRYLSKRAYIFMREKYEYLYHI